jgi:rod shape determining protein RodA
VGGRERRRHRRTRPRQRQGRRRQDGDRAGDFEPGRAAARGKRDLRDNGWFAFFAPRDNPQVAGIVFLEHGMHGPNAASVAHHILDTFFAKQDGRPLPPAPKPEDMRLDFSDSIGSGGPRDYPIRRRCRTNRPVHLSAARAGHPRASAGARGGSRQPQCGPGTAAARRAEAMFERRLYYHIDWALLGAILVISLIGLAQIYSATGAPPASITRRSTASRWGSSLCVVALSIDYRSLADKSHLIYGGILLLLLYVLFFGAVRGGARRWIDFGPLNLQPSEFAKATLALVLAKYFGDRQRGAPQRGDLVIAGAITAVPVLIIGRQPDLGTALTLVPVLFARSVCGGHADADFGILALAGILLAPIAWKFALQDYQKGRISTFLDPSQDAKGAGTSRSRPASPQVRAGSKGRDSCRARRASCVSCRWHTTTSSSRAGRGAWVRRRPRDACALPVRHPALAGRGPSCQGPAGRLPGAGSAGQLHVPGDLQHHDVGRPRAGQGLTLPLMSYGGSSMIATLAGFGLILNVRMRRFTN